MSEVDVSTFNIASWYWTNENHIHIPNDEEFQRLVKLIARAQTAKAVAMVKRNNPNFEVNKVIWGDEH